VTIWRVADGQLLATMEGGVTPLNSLAFSPDGDVLAGGSSNAIRFWRASTGELLHEVAGHTQFLETLAFAPDGRLLASGSSGGTIRLWGSAE
jgi:WD40 repeat protein